MAEGLAVSGRPGASGKVRANAAARRMDRLAELMSNGCASLTAAAYQLQLPIAEVERLWTAIRRGLGPQAR